MPSVGGFNTRAYGALSWAISTLTTNRASFARSTNPIDCLDSAGAHGRALVVALTATTPVHAHPAVGIIHYRCFRNGLVMALDVEAVIYT